MEFIETVLHLNTNYGAMDLSGKNTKLHHPRATAVGRPQLPHVWHTFAT